MKRTLITAAALFLAAITFNSCLGESDYMYSTLEMVNVLAADKFVNDDGVIFNVTESATGSLATDIRRMMISCDVLRATNGRENEYDIKLREYAESKVVEPVRSSEADEEKLGGDAIKVTQGWMTKGYFNALMDVIVLQGSEQEHTVDLVFNEQRSHKDTLFFRIRHNAFGDSLEPEENRNKPFSIANGYLSFPVDKYIPAGTESIVIHLDWEWYKTYENIITLEREACKGDITYKP